jgi:hypothetical protein
MISWNCESLGTYGYRATFNEEGTAAARCVGAAAVVAGESAPRGGTGDVQEAERRDVTPTSAQVATNEILGFMPTPLRCFHGHALIRVSLHRAKSTAGQARSADG